MGLSGQWTQNTEQFPWCEVDLLTMQGWQGTLARNILGITVTVTRVARDPCQEYSDGAGAGNAEFLL